MSKFTNKSIFLIIKLLLIFLFFFLNPTLCDDLDFVGEDNDNDTWSDFLNKYKTPIIIGAVSCILIGVFIYFFNISPPPINDYPVTEIDIILNSMSEIIHESLLNKIVLVVVQAQTLPPELKNISIENLETFLEMVPLNQIQTLEMKSLISDHVNFRELLIALIEELKK